MVNPTVAQSMVTLQVSHIATHSWCLTSFTFTILRLRMVQCWCHYKPSCPCHSYRNKWPHPLVLPPHPQEKRRIMKWSNLMASHLLFSMVAIAVALCLSWTVRLVGRATRTRAAVMRTLTLTTAQRYDYTTIVMYSYLFSSMTVFSRTNHKTEML